MQSLKTEAAGNELQLPLEDVLIVISGLIEAMSIETEALENMDIEAQHDILPKKKLLADTLFLHSEVMRKNPGILASAGADEVEAMQQLLAHLQSIAEENQLRVNAAQTAAKSVINAIGRSRTPVNAGPPTYNRRGMLYTTMKATAPPAPIYRDQRL